MFPRIVNAVFEKNPGKSYPYRVDPTWSVIVGTILRVPAPRAKDDAWVKVVVVELDVKDDFPWPVKDALGVFEPESIDPTERADLVSVGIDGNGDVSLMTSVPRIDPAPAAFASTAAIPTMFNGVSGSVRRGEETKMPDGSIMTVTTSDRPLIGHDLAADLRSETPRHVRDFMDEQERKRTVAIIPDVTLIPSKKLAEKLREQGVSPGQVQLVADEPARCGTCGALIVPDRMFGTRCDCIDREVEAF